MKVVLFCGGLGTRLRDYSETIPKPMVPIGYRPILWHVMRYYAHFGHKDFILCLGYRADAIKQYFLNYEEAVSNDFVMQEGGRKIEVLHKDIDDWRITFVDTGIESNVGERLKAVQGYLRGEEVFLANYSDGLTDFPLPTIIERHRSRQCVAAMLCVRPSQTFHVVSFAGKNGTVNEIQDSRRAGFWFNGGYFVFSRRIFDYIRPGEDLVHEPFQRLMHEEQLTGCRHRGFWACMDTFRDKQVLDDLVTHGKAPWALWERPAVSARVCTPAGSPPVAA